MTIQAQPGMDEISIHALREEGDWIFLGDNRRQKYFYPRPPRGGRPYDLTMTYPIVDFYPRPPRGGRPAREQPYQNTIGISIHALREEGDV